MQFIAFVIVITPVSPFNSNVRDDENILCTALATLD